MRFFSLALFVVAASAAAMPAPSAEAIEIETRAVCPGGRLSCCTGKIEGRVIGCTSLSISTAYLPTHFIEDT